jgi:hypothetical protein
MKSLSKKRVKNNSDQKVVKSTKVAKVEKLVYGLSSLQLIDVLVSF